MGAETAAPLRWFRVADVDEIPEGRVKTVTAGHRSLALTHSITTAQRWSRS